MQQWSFIHPTPKLQPPLLAVQIYRPLQSKLSVVQGNLVDKYNWVNFFQLVQHAASAHITHESKVKQTSTQCFNKHKAPLELGPRMDLITVSII